MTGEQINSIVERGRRRAEVQSAPGDEQALRVLFATFFDATPVNDDELIKEGYNPTIQPNLGLGKLVNRTYVVYAKRKNEYQSSFGFMPHGSMTTYPVHPEPATIGEVRMMEWMLVNR